MIKAYRNIAVACAILASGITMSAPRAAAADAKMLTIDNFTFGPSSVTVAPGTTVTWTNRDDIPHTVTSTTKLFKSQALDTGDTFTYTFTQPGTYAYFCSLHPHMTGTIVVEAVAAR
ncbi:MAG TPA: cupredoxin family copper-binding protein [Xanthobacteraceae bacterium]|jgi:plastocyanin|nr:cupredoxin family copper-binding protein [Xanthobacteraceae bacterium]